MGIMIEGPSIHNVATLHIRKHTGVRGTKWMDIVAVGHDGKELEVASIFDTHQLEVEERTIKATEDAQG